MKACYGASLDPITNGHVWVIRTAASLFEKLTVSVAINPAKRYMFTLEERMNMAKSAVSDIPNVEVDAISQEFLIHHAKRINAGVLIRGVRRHADYEAEVEMASVNNGIVPQISTIFLPCPPEMAKISSSTVKNMMGYNGWEEIAKDYVPKIVLEGLIEKAHAGKH